MSFEILLAKGNSALAANDYQRAILLYNEAEKIEQSNMLLLSNRSTAYIMNKQYKNARNDAKEIIKRFPESDIGYYHLGISYIALNQLNKAEDALQTALQRNPDNRVISNLLENLHSSNMPSFFNMLYELRDSQNEEFNNMITSIISNPRNIMNFLGNKSLLLILQNLLDSYSRPFEAKLISNSYSVNLEAENFNKIGNQFYQNGDLNNALKNYEKAIEYDPGNMTYVVNKAQILIHKREYENSIKFCFHSIENCNENTSPLAVANVFLKIAVAQISLGLFEEAYSSIEKSLQIHGNDQISTQSKNIQNLAIRKRNLLNQDLAKANELRQKANEHYRNHEFDKAADLFTKAIEYSSYDPTLYSNLASALSEINQNDLAIVNCKKAIELDPSFVRGHIKLAKFYLRSNNALKCSECYQKALSLDKNNREAIEGLKEIENLIQDQRRAAEEEALNSENRHSSMENGANHHENEENSIVDNPSNPNMNNTGIINDANNPNGHDEIEGMMSSSELLSNPIAKHILETVRKDPDAINLFQGNQHTRNILENLLRAGLI
ncbi:hypothetical protein TRFO_23595 [Tritrichomonas foetus]|uniref:Uncharacterized protein n=1 Tax=Tritrichomonas foetus TaxID=1144522 RepID=A0A1J4K9F9_9EUKA|nr:hypothetical protein TRFO_23595 [Tritrichomonas foetus]|eukprot:OHT08055.1 hypothetical protein TRFO_23595 [Tritrichomonas foetus]